MRNNPSQDLSAWKSAYHEVIVYGLQPTSSFHELIVKAWMKSDPYNQERLEIAFPKLKDLLISITYGGNDA